MQKYIAVVGPKTGEDDLGNLIAKGISAAIFSIAHQNYALAAKTIALVKELARKNKRPISIIQDASGMTDPMELEFGVKSGAHWVASDNVQHLKQAKKYNKSAGLIFKGRTLPKEIRVDSIMSDSFLDADAEILGLREGQIKHIITDHPDQKILDALLDIAGHTGASSIAVSDLELAKALSWRRAKHKIIYAPKDKGLAGKAALFWGVHPMEPGNLVSNLKNGNIVKSGERVVNATNPKHIEIHII